MQRISTARKQDCCGCGACSVACPQHCISFVRDEEGFDYPCIDAELCNDCGRCRDVCPLLVSAKTWHSIAAPQAYAAWSLDATIRAQSTSGGVFTVLAKQVLSQGGVVYGAAFDAMFRHVRHVRVTTQDGLAALRGSKYVQSRTVEAFQQVRDDLDKGFQVFFSGTPCQIAGLRQLVGANISSLITCDLICHGVPSPGVFEKYMQEQEQAVGAATIAYCFRDKTRGWNFPGVRQGFANARTRYRMNWRDPFMHGFLLNVFLRPVCYVCPYAKPHRVSDITLGDYWGVGSRYPQYDDNRGTSLVFINTIMGEKLLGSCAEQFLCASCDMAHAVQNNLHLSKPAEQPVCRDAFFSAYIRAGFSTASKVYFRHANSLPRAGLRLVKRMLCSMRAMVLRAKLKT